VSVVNWLTMDLIAEEEEGADTGAGEAVDGQEAGQEGPEHRYLRPKNSGGSACLGKERRLAS